MQIETKSRVARPTFRLRDMILPDGLLERTRWRENPFIIYSERRARQPRHRIFMRLFELLLIFWCYQIIRHLMPERATSLSWFHNPSALLMLSEYYHEPTVWSTLSDFYLPIPIAIFTFLLLRYHLMINNPANYIKKLSRDNLAEFMLTDLCGEEYFLQLFLSFCRSYRAPIAWAAIAAVGTFVKHDRFDTAEETFNVAVGTLNIVMLTWIASLGQFAIEWKWFAGGGRARHLRPFLSVFVSIVFAAAIAWVSLALISESEFAAILPICVVTWIAALYVVYQIGLWVDYDSEWQLWRRLNPKDPDETRVWEPRD